MRTMLIDPDSPEEQEKALKWKNMKGRQRRERDRNEIIKKAVPISPLSKHATDNLNALRRADTVTSDPHKTGYVPYPAGGLSYRNGTMKEFVRLAAPEVFHDINDLSVGVNGLEGSKPGAAGAGVLLSHRVRSNFQWSIWCPSDLYDFHCLISVVTLLCPLSDCLISIVFIVLIFRWLDWTNMAMVVF